LILDFKKAINADVPKSFSIEIKQEEFELAESKKKNQNESFNQPQPGLSGISSKEVFLEKII
jgi:hypothetical protein